MSLTARRVTAEDRAAEPAACRHCGAPSPGGEFCCAGCAYVYRLIHDGGFESYYRFKDKVTPPADPSLLQPRDYGWLAQAQKEAEAAAGDRTPELTLAVQGISCAACVWLIEKLFVKERGAGRLEVNAQTGRMRMRWVAGEFDAAAFARTLQSFNYFPGPAGAVNSEVAESRRLAGRIGLCAAFAMNVMLFSLPTYFGMESTFAYAHLFGTLQLVFATLSLLAGGGYFLKRAARALRERMLHIDLPIALGIVGAYAGSLVGWFGGREEYVYFDFVSGFILLMLVGRWAQTAAVERNQRRLLQAQPTPPCVRTLAADGTIREIAAAEVKAGDRVLVPMGQTVPVEARLVSAEAEFNLAWINGESAPRVFRAGQVVPAGAQQTGRTEVAVEATQPWAESLLAQLMALSPRSEYRDRLLERVIQYYLLAILSVAAAAGIFWCWRGGDVVAAGAVVTAVLVVSCPCALGLAFPLADEIATVALRRHGVYVRAGDLWPRLQRVRKIVFDKTGTLTMETPVVDNPRAIGLLNADSRRALLTLVRDNPHPVSRALHEALLAVDPGLKAMPGEVTETIGRGVELGVWSLGRPGWRSQTACVVTGEAAAEDGGDVDFAWAGVVLASFRLRDQVRGDVRGEMWGLRSRELAIFILSGDRTEKVAAMARELGLPLDHGYGGMSPLDKAAWLDENGADDVLMLGDGANDSLAFDRALCRGTPVVHRGVLEQKADFYYLGKGIGGIRALFEVNDARRRTQVVLLVFMIAYNVAAVGLAVAGMMHPLLAAVLMPLSSLATLAIVGLGLRRLWRRE